jgi:DNA-binding HxlR family transcriptional regulator
MPRKVDPCADSCPVARAAQILDGRWTTRIIRDLLSGTKRYSDLQHSLTGISPKVLAERLRMLEKEGIVTKKTFPTVPPRTDYTLTKKGQALAPIIEAMATFGNTHLAS